MARRSRSKDLNTALPTDGRKAQDLWGRGVDRLIEHGKLLWLVGEGLSAVMAAQNRGWTPADEHEFVSSIWSWVQHGPNSTGSVPLVLERLGKEPRGGAAAVNPRDRQQTLQRPHLALGQANLSDVRCPVLWLGSRAIGGAWQSMALGVGLDGLRRVLSLKAGSVRERSVADTLLQDLAVRGLAVDAGILVITEGSRTLDDSLRKNWGSQAQVSHCRTRVREDVLAHVPDARRDDIRAELEDAWSMPVEQAFELLRCLEKKLSTEAPGASERLARSVGASLTVDRLGISSPLKERLLTAGTLRMAFKKSLKFAPAGARPTGFELGVPAWLAQSRRLVGWRGLELLAHVLGNAPRMPKNEAAPNVTSASGAAER